MYVKECVCMSVCVFVCVCSHACESFNVYLSVNCLNIIEIGLACLCMYCEHNKIKLMYYMFSILF